jgi:hypothetical protein
MTDLEHDWAETVAGVKLSTAEAKLLLDEYNDWLDMQSKHLNDMELGKNAFSH